MPGPSPIGFKLGLKPPDRWIQVGLPPARVSLRDLYFAKTRFVSPVLPTRAEQRRSFGTASAT